MHRRSLPMVDPTKNSVPASELNQWDRIAGSTQFKNLLRIKRLFIIPAFIFFSLYFFALAFLIGYAPGLAATRVVGTVTLGYLFGLSQFAVGWLIAGLYLLASNRFDALTRDILAGAADGRSADEHSQDAKPQQGER